MFSIDGYVQWLKKELTSLYMNNFIRGIAFSLVGIFIPIYLLTLNFSLSEVFSYFLVFHIATFIFTPLSLIFSRRIGYKPIFISSIFFMILFFALLYSLENYSIPIYLIALILGIQESFYFTPLHVFFTKHSEDLKRGEQVSHYTSWGILAGLIGPVLGGFIAVLFGFKMLFSIGILFLVASIFPLIKLENIKSDTKISFFGVKKLIKENKKFFLALGANDTRSEVEGIIWPIFTFIVLENIISVGWVGTIVSAGTILFTLFLGRHYDTKNKFFFLKIGGILYALIWALRIFSDSQLSIYALSLGAGFFGLMIAVPFNAMFYDKSSEKEKPDEFIIVKEIPTFVARSLLWILMILLANKFIIAFILAGLSSLFFAIISIFGFEPLIRRSERNKNG